MNRPLLPSECVQGSNGLPPELIHPFKIIAFDWDGTAVMSRHEDASAVRELLENLLELGVLIVVISGTNFTNIDRQLSAPIRGPHKRNLYVATNRGSEVYGFDADSRPVLLWRRTATARENRLLTDIADAVRDTVVARTGLDVRVIYNRLNRRKIDLIPLPEWRDPPKSEIGELLKAVQTRLTAAGLKGGLYEVFELTQKIAKEKGLEDPCITSDVKHIEIGLTDKSESADWIVRELAQKKGIPPEDILVGGDEFGPIAGFEGSDYKMVTPQMRNAVFVSVGPEPQGVPAKVIHLGGGPSRFRQILSCQIALNRRQRTREREVPVISSLPLGLPAPSHFLRDSDSGPAVPTANPSWLIVEEGFNLAREHEIESLFTTSNGYVGTRGSLAEGSSLSSPATFIAGVFDINTGSGSIPELAIAPDWIRLRVIVDGRQLNLQEGEILEHRRILDLRQGILWREWRHRDVAGRITLLRFLRLASLADRHTLLQSVLITPENYSGHVRVESLIEQYEVSEDQYRDARATLVSTSPSLFPAGSLSPSPGPVTLKLSTTNTSISVALATVGVLRDEECSHFKRRVERRENEIIEHWDWEAKIGKNYRLDRLVSLFTSREAEQPVDMATKHLARLMDQGVESVVDAHVRAWEERWKSSDVEVIGDEFAQLAIRFAIYHLISTSNPEDERVSIGARALTGSVYKGHVFWDTEIYMLPFYVFTHPASARALLMYRYHTLPAALQKARAMGYRGALYPWESAHTGEDATPQFAIAPDGEVIRVLSGEQEHHISADIAYAVWQYWQVTGDDDFLTNAGAEILIETARFWASRGKIEADGLYHIRNVIGPDEYHETVDDNAYTNGMAQWNLERAAEVVGLLRNRWPERWMGLAERMQITADEPQEWLNLANIMYTGLDLKTGIFEQFRGYFDLEEIDLAAYEGRTVPMDVLLGRERIQQTKVIKQPDVVMLIYLLWDRFSPQVREANFRYYDPRTGHGSSLSPSIHALIAARLGDLQLAERYFKQAAEIDLANNMGNAAGGVHAAAQGGLWQAFVFGFAGMQPGVDKLTFNPHLLRHWQSLRFFVKWRNKNLQVTIGSTPPTVKVQSLPSAGRRQ